MGRPKKVELNLREKIEKVKNAGLNIHEGASLKNIKQPKEIEGVEFKNLNSRIKEVLNLIKNRPNKASEMLYVIMYDIENNKVRLLLAKYLLEKGCIRIQKSVYLARTVPKIFQEIKEAMREIQKYYENEDSIILIPIPINTPGSMEIIGKDIQIDLIADKPNTLFF